MPQSLPSFLRRLCKLLEGYCVVAFLLVGWPLSAFLILLVAMARLMRRRSEPVTTLGSARWSDEKELRHAGMLGASSGLILGRIPKPTGLLERLTGSGGGSTEWVRAPQSVHTMICGPTGSGKGVSFVIPTLQSNPDSMVVVDFKGELARICAAYRRKRFGHRIVLLDRFQLVTSKPDSYNPMAQILRGDANAIADCADLANAVVVRPENQHERHWDDSAEAVIAAVAATVVGYGDAANRSLQTVRDIICRPEKLETAIQLMTESELWGGALAQMGGQLRYFAEKEKASVISSTLRHLRFLSTPAVAAGVAESSFDPCELRSGKMTVFLIIPPDRAHAQSGLLRYWVSSLLRASMRGGLQ